MKDRSGLLWAALPAMLLMGLGFIALSFTHDGDQAAMWFALFAAVLGVGNGLSSSILLALSADTAPQSDPAALLGSWRTSTDAPVRPGAEDRGLLLWIVPCRSQHIAFQPERTQ